MYILKELLRSFCKNEKDWAQADSSYNENKQSSHLKYSLVKMGQIWFTQQNCILSLKLWVPQKLGYWQPDKPNFDSFPRHQDFCWADQPLRLFLTHFVHMGLYLFFGLITFQSIHTSCQWVKRYFGILKMYVCCCHRHFETRTFSIPVR